MSTSLPAPVWRLIGARAARSLGQGALVAAFSLYLKALGWSASAIGRFFRGQAGGGVE